MRPIKTGRINVLLAGGLIALHIFVSPGDEKKVALFDVGQGDAILLADGQRQILIDGGPGARVLTRLSEEMPLFDRHLEVIILSHPDSDHLEGLMHVLERYEVGLVIMPRVNNGTQLTRAWLARIEELGIPYRFAWVGQRLVAGDMEIEIISPHDSGEYTAASRGNTNNHSVVLRVGFCPGGTQCLRWLLAGDIEERMEKFLVRNTHADVLQANIMKLSHHGSKTSTSAEWLRATAPQAAMVSAGADNNYGHPHPSVLAKLRGMPVWRTDKQGTVRFSFVDGWTVETGR
jgi:competence protein ComEC